MIDLKKEYKDKKVLIIGGLGFIGGNLAEKLVDLEARVSVMDSSLKRYGANQFNVLEFRNKIDIDFGDTRNIYDVQRNILDKEVIFNLSGQIDHNYSMKDPSLDIDLNCKGHINVLQECKEHNPNCRLIFPGSRMQYGKIADHDLPVNENHPLNPLSIYAINKTAGEGYYKAYHLQHNLDTAVVRISNPYGPKAQIKHPGYCIVNWFIRQSLERKDLTIFGNGTQLRDYIFIDDLIEALMVVGIHPNAKGQIFNIGSGKGAAFGDMAKKIVEITGSGKVKNMPWPKEYENVETGNHYSDISKIGDHLGWRPKIGLEEGIKKTVEFYKEHLDKYI